MSKKPRHKKLTAKEQKLVELVTDDNGLTNSQAYKLAYNADKMKESTINTEVSRTLNKPHVRTELAKHTKLVENTLINVVNDWGNEDDVNKRRLAFDSSRFIHDKIYGKATQRTEVRTEVVSLNLNLTGESTEVE